MEKVKAKVLCCIPTRNAEKTIAGLLNNFSHELLEYFTELIIVDNASTDKTVAIAEKILQDDHFKNLTVKILKNVSNCGLGGSQKIAFDYASKAQFDYVFFVHGDNSSNPNQFLPVFKKDFFKYDMVLSTRLSVLSKRLNYPAYRLLFNKILSLVASLICFKKIEDWSSGSLNLYRVQSFISKFESPTRYFKNDVDFPQFLLLYGIYKKQRFYFHPIDLNEPDKKTFKRLISQFIKSLQLLYKYRSSPKNFIEGVYSPVLHKNYKEIKVGTPKEVEVAARAPKRIRPVRNDETFKFTDLNRLSLKDLYNNSFSDINLKVIESIEKKDASILALEINLDINNIIGQGLKSFFLKLFKIYSPNKLIIFLNADENVLKTKQCLDLIEFLNRFSVNFKIISNNPSNLKLWDFYIDKSKGVILNFEPGIIRRSDFYNFAKEMHSENQIYINIITQKDKFYYCYGLREKLIQDKIGASVMLIPYFKNEEERARDHESLIGDQAENSINDSDDLLSLTHTFSETSLGYMRLDSEERIKFARLDAQGNLHIKNYRDNGNIFTESSINLVVS